jgi:hypothetical protein
MAELIIFESHVLVPVHRLKTYLLTFGGRILGHIGEEEGGLTATAAFSGYHCRRALREKPSEIILHFK